jgi:hypothetical protein
MSYSAAERFLGIRDDLSNSLLLGRKWSALYARWVTILMDSESKFV